jgi:hypothetical protein
MCGRMRKLLVCLALVFAAFGVGCSSNEEPPDDAADRQRVSQLPQPTTGPYVSVAVDNHFHDIHPEDDIEIAADRPFVIRNEGRNLHNVTIATAGIDRDIRPGREFRLDRIGDRLDPGVHTIVCKYHADQGMDGRLSVVVE